MAIEKGIAKNMELVGYHDMENRPGFQMAMQVVDNRWYLYCAHYRHQGWTIMDVTDPTVPTFIKFIPEPGGKPATSTLKVQVADGIMITQLQLSLQSLKERRPNDPCDEGIRIWDVKDPENPKHLAYWKTGGGHWIGTHRNYYDGGRYVHLSATCSGFTGHIYRIIDIIDPTHPVEAGRWWIPEQFAAGGAKYAGPMLTHPSLQLHGPYPKGNRAYLAYCDAGLVILDISDISLPKFVGQLKTKPPLGAFIALHSAIPLAKRKLVIISSEGIGMESYMKATGSKGVLPLGFGGIVDISDETNPTLISIFPVPEPPPGAPYKNFHEKPGWFGLHNWHEPHNHPYLEDRDDRAYLAYFNAGVRVYDISDPLLPREIAYYIPPDPKKRLTSGRGDKLAVASEDVLVDKRGYIFVTDSNMGLHVLRCTA
jgi:hypothetical protein